MNLLSDVWTLSPQVSDYLVHLCGIFSAAGRGFESCQAHPKTQLRALAGGRPGGPKIV